MPTITTQQRIEVKLSPAIKKKLKLALARYQTRQEEIAKLKGLQADAKTEIEGIFADADEYEALIAGVKIDDYPLKIVTGVKNTIDWKFIFKNGWMSAEQKNEATKTTPKKAYLKITCPGDDDEESDD